MSREREIDDDDDDDDDDDEGELAACMLNMTDDVRDCGLQQSLALRRSKHY